MSDFSISRSLYLRIFTLIGWFSVNGPQVPWLINIYRHEHLYHDSLDSNLIRSDEFPDDVVGAERLLLGSRVMLCTLSMLSHDKILLFGQVVPIQTIVVDEASQIEIGDYLPPLQRFKTTLRKLVFIGDDKQRE